MRFNLKFEKFYPHHIEQVWRALTTRESLAEWLMPNDFALEVGRRSVFSFCGIEGLELPDHIYITVLAFDAPNYMLWHWQHGDGEPTEVILSLQQQRDGTLLTVEHKGEFPEALVISLSKGWPSKMETLGNIIERASK